MKTIYIIGLVFCSFTMFAQRHSETVKDKDIYGADTQWSCVDKHFGYYFINYLKPLPISNGLENELLSGSFNFGYTYRYKIVDMVDVGAEIALGNRRSVLKKDSLQNFDPGTFYNKIYTYHNDISGSLYLRVNIAKSTYRNLGAFVDLGGFYSYSLGYGTQYVLKSSDLNQKARFKNPEYLSPVNYGGFIRFGYNNLALYANYSVENWISNFSSQNVDYDRSPIKIGIQLNLYAK